MQTICRLPTNCLSVFDYFLGLTLKGLKKMTKINAMGKAGERRKLKTKRFSQKLENYLFDNVQILERVAIFPEIY